MQDKNSKTIWGLNLAVIIVSAIAALGCIIGAIGVGVGMSYVNTHDLTKITDGYYFDWEFPDKSGSHGRSDMGETPMVLSSADSTGLDRSFSYSYSDLTDEDLNLAANLGLGLAMGALIWEIIVAIFTVIVGILNLRNAKNPNKMGTVFGLSLAGAIASFLAGDIVVMVLLIVSTVFASKAKNELEMGAVGQVMQGYNATPYGAPTNDPVVTTGFVPVSVSELPANDEASEPVSVVVEEVTIEEQPDGSVVVTDEVSEVELPPAEEK